MASGGLEPGQELEGTYRIVRRIGEGAMGEVYEATHARLAGRYAIKLLLRDFAADPGLMARFEREARVTSSLSHPNVVQVIDFRQLPDGRSYIVMEYLEGTDLAVELQRAGPLPLARVASLIDQIASGLSAAHELGVVHRDLKPANLFLLVLPGSRRELVKIVDFGISKVRASEAQLTRTATVMGTPQYMSPEQAEGQVDQIDARSDQFSLAAIGYEMLAGRCPFAGDTIAAVIYQLVHVDPPPLGAHGQPVAAGVEAVIRRGLAKRAQDRYPTVLDFSRAFEAAAAAAAAGAPSAAREAAPAPATGAGDGRRRAMAVAGGAVGVAAVVAVILGLTLGRGSGSPPTTATTTTSAAAQTPAQAAPPAPPARAAAPAAPPRQQAPAGETRRAEKSAPPKRKAGRFRHSVDEASGFVKRHFGTGGN